MQEGKNEEGAVMTFGNKGFFGYTLCTPRSVPNERIKHGPIIQWWGTYEAPEPSFSSARAKTIADAENVKQKLLELHSSWKSPRDGGKSEVNGVFKSIIELGCVSEEVADTLMCYHTPVLPRRRCSCHAPRRWSRRLMRSGGRDRLFVIAGKVTLPRAQDRYRGP